MTIIKWFVSGRVPGDSTTNITVPIKPTELYNWYYQNGSPILASLNPALNVANVNETCNSSFECVHDYLIRINKFTSGAVASGLESFEQSRTTLGTVFIEDHLWFNTLFYR